MPDAFTKQPSETFTIQASFVNVLDTGETITLGNSTVIAKDNADVDVTDTVIFAGSKTVSGVYLKAKVQGGTEAASPYKITFLASTDLSNVYEIDVLMTILDT